MDDINLKYYGNVRSKILHMQLGYTRSVLVPKSNRGGHSRLRGTQARYPGRRAIVTYVIV